MTESTYVSDLQTMLREVDLKIETATAALDAETDAEKACCLADLTQLRQRHDDLTGASKRPSRKEPRIGAQSKRAIRKNSMRRWTRKIAG